MHEISQLLVFCEGAAAPLRMPGASPRPAAKKKKTKRQLQSEWRTKEDQRGTPMHTQPSSCDHLQQQVQRRDPAQSCSSCYHRHHQATNEMVRRNVDLGGRASRNSGPYQRQSERAPLEIQCTSDRAALLTGSPSGHEQTTNEAEQPWQDAASRRSMAAPTTARRVRSSAQTLAAGAPPLLRIYQERQLKVAASRMRVDRGVGPTLRAPQLRIRRAPTHCVNSRLRGGHAGSERRRSETVARSLNGAQQPQPLVLP